MASGNWLDSDGKSAKDLVFLQLMVSPKSLHCAANELSMAVRSSQLSDRRAMSSAYSRSDTMDSSRRILRLPTRWVLCR